MRRRDIDVLKGIAIIAVILYHFEFFTYGYLGVDLFLVINGFLIGLGLIRKTEDNSLKYFDFVISRFCRLFPLVIVASIACLTLGAVSMLPDNYENLAMSVVSTNLFSNNILAAITTKNYWDVVNNYKPLMHTWYLGIVAEFYIIIPLLFIIPVKLFKKADKQTLLRRIFVLLTVCFAFSLVLYLLPSIGYNEKFYFIPFRFFELALGSMIAFAYSKYGDKTSHKTINIISVVLLIGLMFINSDFINTSVRLLLTVMLSGIAIVTGCKKSANSTDRVLIPLEILGKKSYSYFIWHQIIVAFYRSYIGSVNSVLSVLVCLMLIILVSEFSYYFVEAKIKSSKKVFIISIICAVIVSGIAGTIYLRAGVIRDVPELDISTKQIQRNIHGAYCDRIYDYDRDYQHNDKIKVFITGNSFARDFANILLESPYADKVDISYAFKYDHNYEQRIKQSDYVFVFTTSNEIFDNICSVAGKDKVWGIGTKNFGENNDRIYIKRFTDSYYDTRVKPTDNILEEQQMLKQMWNDHYVDMMSPLMNENGEIRVFTDDKKYISQDCRHLTIQGAKYYARIIDFESIFENED